MRSRKLLRILVAAICGVLGYSTAFSAPAGAPGIPHRWAPALKQAVGTAYEAQGASSPVWFTLAEGILTEVFYPNVDTPQIGDLQFIVTDGRSFFSEQKRNTFPRVHYKDEGMVVRVTGADPTGLYRYEQEIFTDIASPVLRIRTRIQLARQDLKVHVLFKPAIDGKGSGNRGFTTAQGLFATSGDSRSRGRASGTHVALLSTAPWGKTSAGYVGFSDGWQDLSRNFRLTEPSRDAGPGNIALTGEILGPNSSKGELELSFELALAFGGSLNEATTYAEAALRVPFEEARLQYENGWMGYLRELANGRASTRFARESAFARRSAQIIKMHEDKRARGAIVASLSTPAIPGGERAPEEVQGYHLVWPRDLYHAAMGLLAAGDARTPARTLDYLTRTQNEDGSWSQNFRIDGTPYWRGLQMDQVAFPVLLAAQLKKRAGRPLSRAELEMVRRAASFILAHGPRTQQDRWEEIGGYVPHSIAAEIAALRSASWLTGDPSYAHFADQWQARLESWTLVNEGPWGRSYYLRASPGGQPDSFEPVEIANGGGSARASEILDGGFLELVRLGVRGAKDPRILSTLAIYENPALGIRSGRHYRRYNRDAYGPAGRGGFWPLLAGERGHYAIAAQDAETARAQLHALEQSALESGILPEQFPAELGVASPLVWAHAEDILLHRSIEEGTVFDFPVTP